jgi:hypothetical protein
MRIIHFTLLLIFVFALSGCYTKFYKQNNAKINHTKMQIENSKMLAEQTQPAVVTKSGFYVDTQPISLDEQPAWTRKIITLRAYHLPFNLLINRVLRSCPVVVSYDNTVRTSRLVSMNYTGSIQGALETLAAQTDYGFISGTHDIRWSAFETRTFNISFMPGSSNYLVGQQQSGTSSNNNSNPGYHGTPVGQINDQQYSNLEGQLSVWQDLKNTLDQLKSTKGHIVVSESTTSVTVHDHPSNVRAISQYIAQLNNNLTQQVAIKVQILEVQLNKEFNYGIDWDVVVNSLGTRFNLVGDTAAGANITQNLILNNNSATPSLRIGKPNGAQTLISLLSQQGKVRVVTEPEVVTMNNQIASIRITQNVGYVESISASQSQNFLTTSVTPGSVTDGFTLYILPKIQDEHVYMQITSTIANLERLEKVSTAPNNASLNSSQNNTQSNSSDSNINNVVTQQQYQAIQVPTVSQKAFNQRSTITSGSTLIIAGYKRLRDAVSESDYFGIPPPVGGEGAISDSIETLVLITPIILHSSQSNVHVNTK